MAQPLFRQYLNQARRLARLDPTRPQQGNLRRAVSTAYYAFFHFLIDQSSRFLVGSTRPRDKFRKTMARAYEHGEMAAVARTFRGGTLPAPVVRVVGSLAVPVGLRRLAEHFVRMQENRHLADYDLSAMFFRNDVLDMIDEVEKTFQDWATIHNDPAAEFFLICLLVWERVRGK